MIYNQQSSQEEYGKIVEMFLHGDENTKAELRKRFLSLQVVDHTRHIRNSENITGDYISDSKDIKNSYEIHDAKDVAYSRHVWFNSGDCMDVDTVGYNSF